MRSNAVGTLTGLGSVGPCGMCLLAGHVQNENHEKLWARVIHIPYSGHNSLAGDNPFSDCGLNQGNPMLYQHDSGAH